MRGLDLGYFVRRIGMFFLVVFVAATFNFFIPRLAPGNPIGAITSRMANASSGIENGKELFDAYRVRFGLDQPLYVQYGKYMWNTAHLDFGQSLAAYPADVSDIIGPAIGWSMGLIGLSVILTFGLGIAIGALLAWKGTPKMVRAVFPVTMIGGVLPYYLLAMLLLYVFAFTDRILPMSGAFDSGIPSGLTGPYVGSVLSHAVLPALSIVLTSIGGFALTMRALMVNTIGEDYMLLAEAKGLPKSRILWWYSVRNAIPPQLTHLAIALGYVVSGAILVEIVFSYPGLGYQLYQAIINSDYTVIQAITLVLAVSVGLSVLIIDLIYPRLDPRVVYVAESWANDYCNAVCIHDAKRRHDLRGWLRLVLAFFAENRMFTAGVVLLFALWLFGIIGLLFANPKGADMGAVPLNLSPSAQHFLGTDGLGRDMFSVMVIGIPNTFKIGFVAGAVGVLIGTIIGLYSGYFRGYADTFISSFADVMLVIPALAILITVSAYVRVVTVEIMAVIVGLLAWPLSARVIRSQTLSLRERLFVQVAKLSGENDFEIITRQILPNLTAYIAASFVGAVSGGILASVGLEVLGLGPQNVPTIGRTLFYAFKYTALFRGMWWWWGPPILTLAIIFTGLFWMSISLDRYANPRLKGSAGG